MRILITNEHLDQRGGADLYVRDVARELNRRGHLVMAYSSALSERERSLQRDLIPVATDLERLPIRPDVIYGRHHLDAMSALMALPGCPALLHDLRPTTNSAVPKHPRIRKYVVPSPAAARRIRNEGIDESAIEVLPNAVDVRRFRTIRRPAEAPTQALVYDAPAGSRALLESIKTAAAESGLELSLIGGDGVATDHPEIQLPAFDVVFATGRAALEALACGCAVIVIGEAGCGEMVREDNFERLRDDDFFATEGVMDATWIRGQLALYSVSSCATIAARLHRDASFVRFVDVLERGFREVIDLQSTDREDLDAEQHSASNYLRQLVPSLKRLDEFLKHHARAPWATADLYLDMRAKRVALEAALDKPQW